MADHMDQISLVHTTGLQTVRVRRGLICGLGIGPNPLRAVAAEAFLKVATTSSFSLCEVSMSTVPSDSRTELIFLQKWSMTTTPVVL